MHRSYRLLAAAIVVTACSNAGEGRVLSIPGAGQVAGQVYFDANGNGILDAPSPDSAFRGVAVKLVATGTTDTVARATSAADGSFSFSGITVGNYTVVVDTATIVGTDLHLTRIDTSAVAITPNAVVEVDIAISYRQVSLHAARLLTPGAKVFVTGVALANSGLFGDSILNMADTSGALRITGDRGTSSLTGDTVRVLGIRGTRDNQPVLIWVNLITIDILKQTPSVSLTAAQAANADGGVADAALASISDTVVVQDTATQSGYFRLHVVDAVAPAGSLEVRLDSLIFFAPGVFAKDTVGARFKMSGLLLPTATPGVWMLKPRASTDQRP